MPGTGARADVWEGRLRTVLAPLRVRPYRVYFCGRVLSATGSSVAVIASAFAALQVGGHASDLGWVLAAGMTPQLVLLLVGGTAGDRVSRSRILVGCNLVVGTVQLTVAILVLTRTGRVWQLVVLAAVTGVVTAFSGPAGSGLVPQLVGEAQRQQANALLMMVQNFFKIVGPVLAGLAVATIGAG